MLNDDVTIHQGEPSPLTVELADIVNRRFREGDLTLTEAFHVASDMYSMILLNLNAYGLFDPVKVGERITEIQTPVGIHVFVEKVSSDPTAPVNKGDLH